MIHIMDLEKVTFYSMPKLLRRIPMNIETDYFLELDDKILIRVTQDAYDEYADECILGELERVREYFIENYKVTNTTSNPHLLWR